MNTRYVITCNGKPMFYQASLGMALKALSKAREIALHQDFSVFDWQIETVSTFFDE